MSVDPEIDPEVDAKALAALAVDVARDAAALVERRRAEGVAVAATKSTPTDVVTETDRESEVFIRERILAARPADGFLGEEGADVAGTSGVRWIVDPIDGTVNFLYGIPTYAVSIAAEIDGVAVAGAVINPASTETWSAVLGGGAWLDGLPIRVSGENRLDQALVGTGFGYAVPRRAAQAAVLSELIVRVRDIRRAGAAALDLCAVACGRLDATYERGLNPWDYAAGALVASEAGARVGGLRGAPLSPEFVLVAAPGVYDELHDLLAGLGADAG